jgi:carboxylate-amine ligase
MGDFTLGVEEEVMLISAFSNALANRVDAVLPRLPADVVTHMTPETHGSAVELRTDVHATAGSAIEQIAHLRHSLATTLKTLRLRAASSGTHPFAVWEEIVVSAGERYQFVHGSMRELARREPTFALHVHVGVSDPEVAIQVYNRMRVFLPVLLALSANSPFWQGRDTGLSSARTPLFQAFPRVGVPRPFHSYQQYVENVDLLIRTEAIPEPTFLWWDVRPQPSFGTIEIRVMDSQTRNEDTAALVAMTQCIARREALDSDLTTAQIDSQESICENRFLAARDGIEAEMIDSARQIRVPVPKIVDRLVRRLRPHAQDLGCEAELEHCLDLARENGAIRQRRISREVPSLAQMVGILADELD